MPEQETGQEFNQIVKATIFGKEKKILSEISYHRGNPLIQIKLYQEVGFKIHQSTALFVPVCVWGGGLDLWTAF